MRRILFLLINYIDYESLNALSNIMYIDDYYYRLLLERDYGIRINFKEEYEKMNSNSVPLNDSKSKYLSKYMNVSNIFRIFRLNMHELSYIDNDGIFWNTHNIEEHVEKIEFNHKLIEKPLKERIINDLYITDLSKDELINILVKEYIFSTSLPGINHLNYELTTNFYNIYDSININYENYVDFDLREFVKEFSYICRSSCDIFLVKYRDFFVYYHYRYTSWSIKINKDFYKLLDNLLFDTIKLLIVKNREK
jgi:hypothetical protein